MKPSITTFYSFKGGVGRTSALANISAIVAQMGYRVLMIDFDLEAPGLDAFVSGFDEGFRDAGPSDRGTLWLLEELASLGDDIDFETLNARHVRRVSLPTGEQLWFMPAGAASARYANALSGFDWTTFFDARNGGWKLEGLRRQLLTDYDFVFIDSRTGVTDTGGVCTVQLPDTIVAVYGNSVQSIRGTAAVLDGIQAERDGFAVDRARAIIVPLLGKSDARSEFREARRWAALAHEHLAPVASDWLPVGERSARAFDRLKVPYLTYFSFGERLAVLDEGRTDPELPGHAYAMIAELLVGGPSIEGLTTAGPGDTEGIAHPPPDSLAWESDRIEDQVHETAAKRMAAGLERNEVEALDAIVEALELFVPYLSDDGSEALDVRRVQMAHAAGLERLVKYSYVQRDAETVRLTARGAILARGWDRVAPAIGSPRTAILRNLPTSKRGQRFALASVFADLSPERLSVALLNELADTRSLADQLAREWAGPLRRRLTGAAAGFLGLALLLGLASDQDDGDELPLAVLSAGTALTMLTSRWVRLPMNPRKTREAIRAADLLRRRGVRFSVLSAGRSSSLQRIELEYRLRSAGFTADGDSFVIDDGIFAGLESAFGYRSPLREFLELVIIEEATFTGSDSGGWVIVYPDVYASLLVPLQRSLSDAAPLTVVAA